MTWLHSMGWLASVLERRAEHWICYLQTESEPLARHPQQRDRSVVESNARSSSLGGVKKIRCLFAAYPKLERQESVPKHFFADDIQIQNSKTAYLIPYFALDAADKPQELPCLMWSFSDFIELTGDLSDACPDVQVGGERLADLSDFFHRTHQSHETDHKKNALERSPQHAPMSHADSDWSPSESPDSVRRMIEHLQRGMRRGDYYLANASTRLQGPKRSNQTISLSRFVQEWLDSPVRQGVFVDCGKDQPLVCCFSPERFIARDSSRVQTEPIKGTAPFIAAEPQAGVNALWSSQKEMSEQTLVTDLLRNDLNRVCVPGSVVVSSPYEIHATQALLQMQSVVEGELRNPNISHLELLGALLPAGSITGTPKWAVSREICAIEATHRGYYTGVFAYGRSPDEMDSTVLIRGFFADKNAWMAGLGAGITTLSVPEAEAREFDLKWQSFAARWQRLIQSKDAGVS